MIDLNLFTSKDPLRPELLSPVYLPEKDISAASDGQILICTRGRFPGSTELHHGAIFDFLDLIAKDNDGDGAHQIPEIKKAQSKCILCSGSGAAPKCPECHARAVLLFQSDYIDPTTGKHASHDYECVCATCYGTGNIEDDSGKCAGCHGAGYLTSFDPAFIPIGSKIFSASELSRITAIPDLYLYPASTFHFSYFAFPGGFGAIVCRSVS